MHDRREFARDDFAFLVWIMRRNSRGRTISGQYLRLELRGDTRVWVGASRSRLALAYAAPHDRRAPLQTWDQELGPFQVECSRSPGVPRLCGTALSKLNDRERKALRLADAVIVEISAPPWAPLALFTAGPVWCLLGVRLRRARRRRRGCCLKCGYNLTGNVSGVCPECGAPVGGANDAALLNSMR